MRGLPVLLLLALLFGCKSGNPVAHTPPPSGGGGTGGSSFAGTWAGTVTDTSGSLMGTGIGNGGTIFLFQLSQTGSHVSGTITLAGGATLPPGQSAPTVTGTVSGSTMTFVVAITPAIPPIGSMPGPNGSCSATGNGTMTMNATANSMTGTYTGSSSCTGGFANGQITLTRQ